MLPSAIRSVLGALLAAGLAPPATALTIDFEDVGQNLPIDGNDYYDGADGAGGFTSSGANFSNRFTDFGGGFTGWEGFAYSQTTDSTTPGFGNQYSAFPGGGAGGSPTYGVGYTAGSENGGVSTLTFGGEREMVGGYFTTTTYSALSMRDGDGFAKQFGGPSGDDMDWLLLTILGFSSSGHATGSVGLYLADYRFADNDLDYILDAWTWVDLSPLGSVHALDFVITGSDVGTFGLNTPSYFALDDLRAVPEPGTALLLALGLTALPRRRR
jgi:hypothetical protein